MNPVLMQKSLTKKWRRSSSLYGVSYLKDHIDRVAITLLLFCVRFLYCTNLFCCYKFQHDKLPSFFGSFLISSDFWQMQLEGVHVDEEKTVMDPDLLSEVICCGFSFSAGKKFKPYGFFDWVVSPTMCAHNSLMLHTVCPCYHYFFLQVNLESLYLLSFINQKRFLSLTIVFDLLACTDDGYPRSCWGGQWFSCARAVTVSGLSDCLFALCYIS